MSQIGRCSARWWWVLVLAVLCACDGGTRGSGIGTGIGFATVSGSLAATSTGAATLALNAPAGDASAAVVVQVREAPDVQTVVDPVTHSFTLSQVPAGDITIDFISTQTASISLRGLPENVDLQMVNVILDGAVAKPAGFAIAPEEGGAANVQESRRKGATPVQVTFALTDVSIPSLQQVVWSFGDGTRSGRVSTSHEYAEPGNYVVEATLEGGGETQRAFTVIEAFPPTERSLQVTASADPERGRAPLNVLFHAATENEVGSVDYEWNFGDGSPNDFGPAPRHAFTLDGIYLVQVTAVDAEGNTERDVVQVEVSSGVNTVPLSVTASVDVPSGTAPLTVNLMPTIRGSGLVSIEWDFDDGTATSTQPSPEHTYVTPGIYFPTVTVTESSSGDKVSAQVMVEVLAASP